MRLTIATLVLKIISIIDVLVCKRKNLVICYLIYMKERGYCVHYFILDCIDLEINLHIIMRLTI